jgi:hypothetical protein
MSFVTFEVKQPHASDVADGQLEFTWSIDTTESSQPLTGTLSYRITAHAPVRMLLTITGLAVNPDGTYTPPAVTFSPANKVNIPRAGSFAGGNYNTLSNMVFIPSPLSPQVLGVFTGTFSNTHPTHSADDQFDWQANVTTPLSEEVEAGY